MFRRSMQALLPKRSRGLRQVRAMLARIQTRRRSNAYWYIPAALSIPLREYDLSAGGRAGARIE